MIVKPTVFTICGVHNNLVYTKKLLACIKKQTYPNIKTIIIDDGSTDGTASFIRKNYPEIIILEGNGNLWWTGALYEGVEEALTLADKDDYILTVNNDCTFNKDLVSILVKTSQENKGTIVGSLIVDKDNRSDIIDAGVQIDWLKGEYISLPPEKIVDLPKDKLVQEKIDTLSTKGTLYPVTLFKRIGNFDKKHLPHYISDYEFACRAKKAGFKLLLSYKARIYNDTVRTGFGGNVSGQITLKEYWNLLFSRRSRLNIIDQYQFIRLCYPLKYKLRNYILIFLKIFYFLSFVAPFSIIRQQYKK